MERLTRLFGRSIRLDYHCFDRIVISGYLSTLSRPGNIVYFLRTIKQVDCIGKETLRQRTDPYPGGSAPMPGTTRSPWSGQRLLACDLRKLKAHGLIERPDNRYVYMLSDYGRKAAASHRGRRSASSNELENPVETPGHDQGLPHRTPNPEP